MRICFTEVLARENVRLAEICDGNALERWRAQLVAEVLDPDSPYMSALGETDDEQARAEFLAEWREFIARMVERVLRSRTSNSETDAPGHGPTSDVDAEKIAVLILAALHGGAILSQLARDPQPLNAALDLALVPMTADAGIGVVKTGPNRPVSSMDV